MGKKKSPQERLEDSIQNMQVEIRPIGDLEAFERNSKKHPVDQIQRVALSMREFGWTNPVLIREDGTIIAGHCRILAAREIGVQEVPVIVARGWTEAQCRAYTIADNKLAESEWDQAMLKIELKELELAGFDMECVGFSGEELVSIFYDLDGDGAGEGSEGSNLEGYTQKVQIPIYEPSEKCPPLHELWDRTKADSLQAQVKASSLPADIKKFLMDAAERFVEFRFDRIADFYAHSAKEVQELIEESALVLIDYDKAIERGFVRPKDDIDEAFADDHPDA